MEHWNEFRECMEMMPSGVVFLRVGTVIQMLCLNRLAREMSGYSEEELFEKTGEDALSTMYEEDRPAFQTTLLEAIGTHESFHVACRFAKKDGTLFWVDIAANYLMDEGGDPIYRCLLVDTTRRRETEQQILQKNLELQHRMEYDALTDIYNRASFYKYASEKMKDNQEIRYALVTCDISRFKIVNELYGMEYGDKILCCLAEKIHDFTGEDGVCGRLTSDHFAMCLPLEGLDPDQMMEELQSCLRLNESEQRLDLYAGIYGVEDVKTPVSLMCDRANLALNTIKGSYLQHFAYYNDSMKSRLLEEQQLIYEMQTALDKGQFCVFLQPIFSAMTGAPVAAEALVRWRHPVRGIISPGIFIPLAERNGFVTRIDWYVWEEVCRYIQERKQRGEKVLPVSVNISRLNFYTPGLCAKIYEMVCRYGVNTSELRFEITENAYMEDPKCMTEIVEHLHSYGFHVLMDDFGSEYSSLNMLKDIRVDFLKIDMCFLNDFRESGRGANVISSVIRMAKWLDTGVIAEGVETRQQRDFLKSVGCDLIQGFYYSRPLEEDAFGQLLEDSGRQSRTEEPLELADDFDVELLFNNSGVNFLFNGMISGLGIYEMVDDSLEVLRVNDGYYEVMHSRPEQVFRDARDAFTHVEALDRGRLLEACKEAQRTDQVQNVTIQRKIEDGQTLWLDLKIRWIGKKGKGSVFFFMIEDVTERRNRQEAINRASKDLERQNELCRMLMEDSDMVIFDYDVANDEAVYSVPLGDGTRMSKTIERYRQFLQNTPPVHRDDLHNYMEYIQRLTKTAGNGELVVRADYMGGSYRWYRVVCKSLADENRKVYRIIGRSEDISVEQRWKERAERDGLTGLLNRETMESRVNEMLLSGKFCGAFFLFDVDNFKIVNDTCGHTIGDALLMCIARTFDQKFRDADLKSRLGGDELAVLTVNPMSDEMLRARAVEMLTAVNSLQSELQMPVPVSISIGIVAAGTGIDSFEDLYRKSDEALYQAKQHGKNCYFIA